MLRQRTSRRLASWLALLAMALNASWPLLAHAKPAHASEMLIEACTAAGMNWIAVDGSDRQPAQQRLVPHCEYCSLGADRAPLPATAVMAPMRVSLAIATIAPRTPAPAVAQPSHCAAPARAPPAVS